MEPLGYERGVFVHGSPLWFDAERRRELCVVCDLHRSLPPLHRRVLAPAPLAAALRDAGYAGEVLPLPWGRWVGVGGHRLQLLARGPALGQASALIQTASATVLWAGALGRPDALWHALGPPLHPRWPKASEVVVRLPALQHVGLPFARAMLQLAAEACEAARLGLRPGIHVESASVGWAVWEALSDLGLNPRPVGLLRKLLGPRARPAGLLPPGGFCPPGPTIDLAAAACRSQAGHIRIDTGLGTWGAAEPDGAPTLALGWYADMAAVQQLVQGTGARTVRVLDAGGDQLQALSGLLGPRVQVTSLGCALSEPAKSILPVAVRPIPFEGARPTVLSRLHEPTAQRPSRRHRGAAPRPP
jgi:hypothetical protein